MAALAALGIPALLGLPGFIGGILDAVNAGKKLHGGRIMMARKMLRHPVYAHQLRQALRAYRHMSGKGMRMRHRRRRGRGIASSIAGAIPLIGPLLGPLVGALGGRVRRRTRGRGLVPMSIYQPIAWGGRLMARRRRRRVGGYGRRGGLLSPTGMGGAIYRRGYYKHVNGRRVYVHPTVVRGGRLRRRRRY